MRKNREFGLRRRCFGGEVELTLLSVTCLQGLVLKTEV